MGVPTDSIKLTTAAPHSHDYEGTLFTACPILNVVAINTRSPPPNPATNAAAQPGDYHIIPISRIQSFQLLALASAAAAAIAESGESDFAHAQPAIGPVDAKRLQQREDERVRKLMEEEQNRGKGVTDEAQALFDAMRKMYVCPTHYVRLAGTLSTDEAIPTVTCPSAGTTKK